MEPERLPRTLLVKHLPQQLSDVEQQELLKQFGAQKVKQCNAKGPLKYSAFAQFPSHEKASCVLKQLHQLEILGKRLSVEYAKKNDIFDGSEPKTSLKVSETEKITIESTEPDLKQISGKINSISEKWNISYPTNPKLRYSYPSPSVSILTNIANALAAVPRFYVQVLHLMNRMNLPAPFGEITPTPPLPEHVPAPLPPEEEIEEAEMTISSTEESELESDEDSVTKEIKEAKARFHREEREKRRLTRKRARMVLNATQNLKKQATSNINIADIFEPPSAKVAKKIEIKQVTGAQTEEIQTEQNLKERKIDIFSNQPAPNLPNMSEENMIKTEEEIGGFGKMEPVQKIEIEEDEEQEEELDTEFISSRKLRRGRISSKEMRELNVFKGYKAGEPSSRLYIKNIAKQTTEKDLRYIFGRYVDWDNELEKTMFDVRLMRAGRMKGQSFVSLPSAEKAQEAVKETNGFEFNGKPLVVQFAMSSKPKDTKPDEKSGKSAKK